MSCVSVSEIDMPQALPAADRYSGALHAVMASELREMGAMLERLAEVLISDQHIAATYLEQLQSFDYLIQHADECANLMERIAAGQDSLTAIGHIRLAEVQDRVRAAIKGK